MDNKKKPVPEIVIPKGYSVEDMLDLGGDELKDEKPIYIGRVVIKYERDKK